MCALALVLALSAGCQFTTAEQGYLQRGKELVAKKEYSRALIEFKNAARIQPNNPEVYYQASLAYLAMGDYKTAYQGLVKATEVDPKHAAAHNKLAELIASSVNSTRDPEALKEAEQRVQAALAIMPNSADALGALGLTEYLMGKPEDAAAHLQSALEKFPKHIPSARALAMIRLDQGDTANAEQILMRAAEDSKAAEAYDTLGRFYALQNRAAAAEAAYRKAVSINPRYGAALQDLYTVLYATGRKEKAEKILVAMSSLPDKQYHSLHALFLLENGKQQEGIAELERQAAAAPTDREAFTRLTSAYFFTRRFPDAERVINAAIHKNPKDTSALLERGKLYIITAKFAEAEADLNQVRKAEPNSAIAHFLLAKVFQAKGRESLLRDELATALQLDSNMLVARVELAQLLSRKESVKSAVELLDQAPPKQKTLLPVILQRNWALLVADDATEVAKGIEMGLSLYPENPDLHLQEGIFQLRQKNIAGARKSLEAALAVQPDKAEAVDTLAKTYVNGKNTDKALQVVQEYAAKRPQSAQLQNLLGNWMAANGRFDEARKAFLASLTAAPGFMDARMAAAYVELADGKLDQARKFFEYIPRTPRTQVKCELGLAQVEEKAKNAAAAIQHYRKALEADPSNVPALNSIAYLLANETGQADEALKYAQQAQELAPNNVFVEDTIGWAYFRKGLYSNAVDHLQRAAARADMAVIRYHLAMAYMKSGDTEKGRIMFRQASLMEADTPEALAALKIMKEAGNRNN